MKEILQLGEIVKKDSKVRSSKDERRLVNKTIASYYLKGEEYRKSFESYDEPVVPKSGTHKELNDMKYQGF
jgi:hypothetical protein